MYTAAENRIHEVSPEVLIICEGTGFAADLTGVARHPVRLEHPGKVACSSRSRSAATPMSSCTAACWSWAPSRSRSR